MWNNFSFCLLIFLTHSKLQRAEMPRIVFPVCSQGLGCFWGTLACCLQAFSDEWHCESSVCALSIGQPYHHRCCHLSLVTTVFLGHCSFSWRWFVWSGLKALISEWMAPVAQLVCWKSPVKRSICSRSFPKHHEYCVACWFGMGCCARRFVYVTTQVVLVDCFLVTVLQ